MISQDNVFVDRSPALKAIWNSEHRESETTIKIKFAFFRGGGQGGREENCPKLYFYGKRHDNKF